MPMSYDPKDADNCWPADNYDAELTQVLDRTSKIKPDGSGGNPMQELKFRVHNKDGRTQIISDYVVIPAALFKLKQLAKALGREADFNAGNFQADDYQGAALTVELAVEPSDEFGDKNKIKKYKVPTASSSNGAPTKPYPRNRESVLADQANRPLAPIGSSEQQFKENDIPF